MCQRLCTVSIKIADSIPDIKYRLLDLSGIDAESVLEVTPATCNITQLGVVRLWVMSISGDVSRTIISLLTGGGNCAVCQLTHAHESFCSH